MPRLLAPSVALSLLVFPLAVAQSQDDSTNPWPRQIDSDRATVVIYQPQLESFEGNTLTGRSAVSVTMADSTQPVFGAVWMSARVETDREERMVTVVDVSVTNVRFPEATEEGEKALADLLENEMPKWNLGISLDRLQASLGVVDQEKQAAAQLKHAPPTIRVVDYPAVLVTIDGAPQLQQAGDGLMAVMNSPFVIVLDMGSYNYFLYAGTDAWYQGDDALGPWNLTDRVPSNVLALVPPDTTQVDPEEQDTTTTGAPPRIVTVTEPTELISSNGPPDWAPIDSTSLLYMANTESDVLMEIESQQYYVVLSGRWYRSGSLQGPWSWIPSDSLAPDFANIPVDSDQGYLRVFVAGTQEAQDAVLDSQIPQTEAVLRSAATLEVTYDGDPKFEPIDGIEMQYAANTDTPVMLINGGYFACEDAVWYTAPSPNGPWVVADSVPDEIYTQPPSSPVYNTKYVYVYGSSPDTVYVGYTPGYTGSYVYETTVVYGTGYSYNPWYGNVYYGWPSTWGFHVHYNPWFGWSMGFSYHYGPFTFGFGWGWHRPVCCWGGLWGPRGYRAGYRHGYHRGRQAGFYAGYRAGSRNRNNNIYRAQPSNRARNAQRAQGGGDRRAQSSVNRPNNTYADRNGNVSRNQNGSWQSRSNGSWSGSRPSTGAQPSTGNRAGSTPSTLDRQQQARNHGTNRTQSYQRSRSGGGRGGGGRRR